MAIKEEQGEADRASQEEVHDSDTNEDKGGLTKVSAWIPSKLNDKLEDLAEKRGISKSDVIRIALLDRLKGVKPVDQQVIKKLLADSHDFLWGFDLDKFLKQARARGLNTSELWNEANIILLKDAILEDVVGDEITDELENDEISKVATELGIEESFLRKAWNLAEKPTSVETEEGLVETEVAKRAKKLEPKEDEE